MRDLLANRLKEYAPSSALEQENVLQETMLWTAARRDIERFVITREQPALEAWSRDPFLQQLERLAEVWTVER